jgi:hypothetical protein
MIGLIDIIGGYVNGKTVAIGVFYCAYVVSV